MEIEDKIRVILSEHLAHDISEVTDDKNIADDLGADSLDAVELAMTFEEEFGVEITDEDVENLPSWTVGQVIAKMKELTR